MTSLDYLKLRDGEGCQECGAMDHLTRDHIWPESKGGCNCFGNLQVLCARCNLEKNDLHEEGGHTKDDCPQPEFQRFMKRWKTRNRQLEYSEVEEMLAEVEELRLKLADYACSPFMVHQAHQMTGTLRAYLRDFDEIQQSRKSIAEKKTSTLKALRRTEEKLTKKLAEVRERIAQFNSDVLDDEP